MNIIEKVDSLVRALPKQANLIIAYTKRDDDNIDLEIAILANATRDADKLEIGVVKTIDFCIKLLRQDRRTHAIEFLQSVRSIYENAILFVDTLDDNM